MKKYRFFFHYYRQKGCMSVHFRGSCLQVDHIDCRVPVETKYNKTQPRLVLRGMASNMDVHVIDGVSVAIIR